MVDLCADHSMKCMTRSIEASAACCSAAATGTKHQ